MSLEGELAKGNLEVQAAEELTRTYLATGKVADAHDVVDAARKKFQAASNTKGEAITWLLQAEIDEQTDDLSGAMNSANEAVAFSNKIGDKKLLIKVFDLMVRIYVEKELANEAVSTASEMLAVAKEDQNQEGQALAYQALSRAQCLTEVTVPDAIDNANEALRRFRELEDPKHIAAAMVNIASLRLWAQNNPQPALQMAQTALKAYEKLGESRDKAAAIRVAAMAHMALGEFLRASVLVKDEIASYSKLGNLAGECEMQEIFINMHWHKGDLNMAYKASSHLLNLRKQMGDKHGEARASTLVSELLCARNAMDLAEKRALEAKEIYTEVASEDGINYANRVLSMIYVKKGEPDLAPNRSDALRALSELAQAVHSRDAGAFKEVTARLNTLQAYSDLDVLEVIGPILQESRAQTTKFLEEQGAIDRGAWGSPEMLGVQLHQTSTYMNFLDGGIRYGPKFRSMESFRIAGDSGDVKCAAVIKTASDSEDWEQAMKFNPGLLDGCFQSMAVLPVP